MGSVFDEETVVRVIVKTVLENQKREPLLIPVGISNRHVHLSPADIERIFGPGYQMRIMKDLYQPGYYANEECVTLVGPKGAITNVRVLGPPRANSQVEISIADGYTLGIKPPVQESGTRVKTPCLTIVGPEGAVTQCEGVMCAARHIHMNGQQARALGIKDGQMVSVRTPGDRPLIFNQVKVRVDENFVNEIHIDVDEANAANLKNGDFVELLEGFHDGK